MALNTCNCNYQTPLHFKGLNIVSAVSNFITLHVSRVAKRVLLLVLSSRVSFDASVCRRVAKRVLLLVLSSRVSFDASVCPCKT